MSSSAVTLVAPSATQAPASGPGGIPSLVPITSYPVMPGQPITPSATSTAVATPAVGTPATVATAAGLPSVLQPLIPNLSGVGLPGLLATTPQSFAGLSGSLSSQRKPRKRRADSLIETQKAAAAAGADGTPATEETEDEKKAGTPAKNSRSRAKVAKGAAKETAPGVATANTPSAVAAAAGAATAAGGAPALTSDAMDLAAAAGGFPAMTPPDFISYQGYAAGGMPGLTGSNMTAGSSAIFHPSSDPSIPNLPISSIRPQPYVTSNGYFMSEPDPFGQHTPSDVKFRDWHQLDDFIKMLSIKNGFRHVLRRSHKDDKGEYRHGTYVCEFHASPLEATSASAGPTRASSRSIRLACPYKINFARQGEGGIYHINKRVMQHNHFIDASAMMGPGMPGLMGGMGGLMPGLHPGFMFGLGGANAGAGALPISNVANNVAAAVAAAANPAGSPTLLRTPSTNGQDVVSAPKLKRLLVHSKDTLPLSEQSNPISEGCETMTAGELVRAQRECDAQMFSGYHGLQAITDDEMILESTRLIDFLRRSLASASGVRIVVSSTNTIGRYVSLIVHQWRSQIGGKSSIVYIGAGSSHLKNDALEDDAARGRSDIEQAVAGASNVIFIGVASNLSSAYLAAQLEYCTAMQQQRQTPVHIGLINFSSTVQSDLSPVIESDGAKALRRQFDLLPSNPDATVLNTVVGPEFLTGSSRLKAASATFIVLDTIFRVALSKDGNIRGAYLQAIEAFESVTKQVYKQVTPLSQMIDFASSAIGTPNPTGADATAAPSTSSSSSSSSRGSGGHVYLVSLSSKLGRVALFDAADLSDTFGYALDTVRAFVRGGVQPAVSVPPVQTLAAFKQQLMAGVTSKDFVVLILSGDDIDDQPPTEAWTDRQTSQLVQSIADTGVSLVGIHVASAAPHPYIASLNAEGGDALASTFEAFVNLSVADPSSILFSMKVLLNCISTGVGISTGSVLSNRPINLRVTNVDTYTRAVSLISDLTSVAAEVAERQLLRAIYSADTISEEQRLAPISKHIERAASMSGVVPLALMLSECEHSKERSSGPLSAGAPAISCSQATRRLQHATFQQLMRDKYDTSAPGRTQKPTSAANMDETE